MKKYFVISDIHSFASIMKNALKDNGYDKENPEHILIVCGDVFDRGDETAEVYNFLKSIPENRCILIRGNHEQLYFDLLNKDFPQSHDFSNGTVRTFCHIAGSELNDMDIIDKAPYDLKYDPKHFHFVRHHYSDDVWTLEDLWNKIKKAVQNSEVTKWLRSDRWINYYELGKYIFVHSFIPLTWESERGLTEDYCVYYAWTQMFKERPDWRNATTKEWSVAAWGCPYKFFDAGLFNQELKNDKILVCGHYRCSEFNEHYLYDFTDNSDIYFGKNLIAIDATTAWSKQVNVLVIEDGICYSNGKKLVEKEPKRPKWMDVQTVTIKKEGDSYEPTNEN